MALGFLDRIGALPQFSPNTHLSHDVELKNPFAGGAFLKSKKKPFTAFKKDRRPAHVGILTPQRQFPAVTAKAPTSGGGFAFDYLDDGYKGISQV